LDMESLNMLADDIEMVRLLEIPLALMLKLPRALKKLQEQVLRKSRKLIKRKSGHLLILGFYFYQQLKIEGIHKINSKKTFLLGLTVDSTDHIL
jgi:hypothetical protein